MKSTESSESPAPSPLNYTTIPTRIGFFSRLFPGLVFYLRMLASLRWAARLISTKRSTPEQIELASYMPLRAIEKSGARARIENISVIRDLDGPCVVVGNHMSSLETLILPWLIGS